MMKIISFLFLVTLLQASSVYDLSIKEFVDRVSKANNIVIYLDEELSTESISVFIPGDISPKSLLSLFMQTVKKSNLRLISTSKNVYYLSKRLNYKTRNYIYSLKYNSFEDCRSYLSMIGVKYKYLENINSFLIISNSKRYPDIERQLSAIDVLQDQATLKIVIFEYSDSDLQERGIQYGTIYNDITSTVKTALNSIIYPISNQNPLLSSKNFYAAVRLLNQNEIIDVKQYPYILVKNNKSFKFESVENIPYLISSTTTQATNVSEQNTIQYKDVGLKISGKSLIYDDYITLDLDLIIEDIINGSDADNMPRTYKRVLKSNTNVRYNDVLLLSGLKRTKKINNDWSIPYISNIPYLGEMFKYKTKSVEIINIVIGIEVIKQDKGIE